MPQIKLIQYERNLHSAGTKLIAGVDEAGRGPLAGPMVVGAVILDVGKVLKLMETEHEDIIAKYSKINDSKRLTPQMRCILDEFIRNEAISYSVVPISHKKIDAWGIAKCTQVGFFTAIKKLHVKPEHILTDHFEIRALTKHHQTNIPKGDAKSITVAAASILAKVFRDNLMLSLHNRWPHYGFDKHKGYGTKLHKEMIALHGPCEIHRRSFKW